MKSYNPFKMISSYIGAAVGLMLSVLWFVALYYQYLKDVDMCSKALCGAYKITYLPANYPVIRVFLSPIIIGFLIGWVIHAIIRWFKR